VAVVEREKEGEEEEEEDHEEEIMDDPNALRLGMDEYAWIQYLIRRYGPVEYSPAVLVHLHEEVARHALPMRTLLTGSVYGWGLYPETASFRHSCDPSCVAVFGPGGRVSVVTVRPVGPGEPLTLNRGFLRSPFAPRLVLSTRSQVAWRDGPPGDVSDLQTAQDLHDYCRVFGTGCRCDTCWDLHERQRPARLTIDEEDRVDAILSATDRLAESELALALGAMKVDDAGGKKMDVAALLVLLRRGTLELDREAEDGDDAATSRLLSMLLIIARAPKVRALFEACPRILRRLWVELAAATLRDPSLFDTLEREGLIETLLGRWPPLILAHLEKSLTAAGLSPAGVRDRCTRFSASATFQLFYARAGWPLTKMTVAVERGKLPADHPSLETYRGRFAQQLGGLRGAAAPLTGRNERVLDLALGGELALHRALEMAATTAAKAMGPKAEEKKEEK
jgi:hypothetical protein